MDDPLLVGVRDDQRPVARSAVRVLEDLLEQDHLAGPLVAERVDDVERVVEQDLLPALELLDLERRRHRHAQLAAAGEDVDRAVLVCGQEDAVAAGRLGEPVNLFLESDDLGPGFLEGRHEPVVVLGQSGQLRLRCREPFLELPDVSGAFGQLPPNQGEFLLQERDLAGEIVGLFLPTCGA